jgi:AraC-like DNA-binding protein
MGYFERRFEGALALVAECSWSLEQSSGAVAVYPDGFADVFVNGSGQVYVVGTAKSVRRLGPEFAGLLRGVRLRAVGFRRIFGVPASELTDRIVPLGEIPSASAKRIASMVLRADSASQAMDLLSKKLCEQAAGLDLGLGRMFEYVLRRLDVESVAQIASGVGVTDRHLRRIFLDCVGISPSRLRRIRRFQRVLDEMRRWNGGSSLAGCALDCGFADQAHFNRDIRELAGTSPMALLQRLTSEVAFTR